MTAVKIPTGELVRVHSHYYQDDHSKRKEEVYLTYATEWRGVPCLVTMSCDRYRGSENDRWTNWRVYANDARTNDGTNAHVSETARARLSAAMLPQAEAWLASDDYAASRRNAVAHMLQRVARDMTERYMPDDARHLRQALAKFGHELNDEQRAAFDRVADTFDVYAAAYNAL